MAPSGPRPGAPASSTHSPNSSLFSASLGSTLFVSFTQLHPQLLCWAADPGRRVLAGGGGVGRRGVWARQRGLQRGGLLRARLPGRWVLGPGTFTFACVGVESCYWYGGSELLPQGRCGWHLPPMRSAAFFACVGVESCYCCGLLRWGRPLSFACVGVESCYWRGSGLLPHGRCGRHPFLALSFGLHCLPGAPRRMRFPRHHCAPLFLLRAGSPALGRCSCLRAEKLPLCQSPPGAEESSGFGSSGSDDGYDPEGDPFGGGRGGGARRKAKGWWEDSDGEGAGSSGSDDGPWGGVGVARPRPFW